MPATIERAAFIREEFRIAKAGPNTSVVANHGDNARRSKEPIPTYFVYEADAQIMATERLALLSSERRIFDQQVAKESVGLSLQYLQGPPTIRVIDDERGADHSALVYEIGVEYVSETTKIGSWG